MFKIFKQFVYRSSYSTKCTRRKFSTNKELIAPKISRSDKITTAIKLYVTKCNEADGLIAHERKEFEFGRRYLAKMMGGDPETFNQNDIDESIRYLFPSGLFDKEARPIMTDPANIHPKKIPLLCDNLGRPFDTFYYTGRPVFYRIMHDGVYLLEKLKLMEDLSNKGIKQEGKPIELYSSRWMNEKEFSAHCSEKISPEQYKGWLLLMETIVKNPHASVAENFLMSNRKFIAKEQTSANLPQPVTDLVTGKRSVESYGQKKWDLVTLRVTMPGTGKFFLNKESLLDVMPLLGNRECVLFPLQFTDTVGRVDVEGTFKSTGQSNLAYAVRLAVSRCLSVLLSEEEAGRMRLAGLLTQDERYKERKQPGKPKARKSPPWRPR